MRQKNIFFRGEIDVTQCQRLAGISSFCRVSKEIYHIIHVDVASIATLSLSVCVSLASCIFYVFIFIHARLGAIGLPFFLFSS